MVKGTAGTRWRQLLVLLIVTSGATLAWMKTRRHSPGSIPRSWSELNPVAPASLRPVAAAHPAVESISEAPRVPAAASAAARTPAAEPETVLAPEQPVAGPYPGSVLALDDGSAPSEEFLVKGNAGSMRSHSTSSPYFGRTRAEVWFRSQEDAAAAGFAPWAPKK